MVTNPNHSFGLEDFVGTVDDSVFPPMREESRIPSVFDQDTLIDEDDKWKPPTNFVSQYIGDYDIDKNNTKRIGTSKRNNNADEGVVTFSKVSTENVDEGVITFSKGSTEN